MMKRRIICFLLPLLSLGFVTTSCIRDEIAECPPLQITVAVKDKNYFNAAEVAAQGVYEPVSESLPFGGYISTLYYKVADETGKTVLEQSNMPVEGDGATYDISLPADLPYGKYRITLWGNMKSDRPLAEDASAAEMEHADAAQNDIYLGDAEMDYRYGTENHIVQMERAKGRLIIVAENLPGHIDRSEKTVAQVYSVVTRGFEYSGLCDLTSRTEWPQPNDITTHTLTCPSEGVETATLSVEFQDADNESVSLVPKEVKLTMERNRITVVKYTYEEEKQDFKISVLVDNNWEEVHDMVIN